MKSKVLVYKPELLPYSETFIKAQLLAYQAWHGVLVGHLRLTHGLSLDGLDVRLLLNDPPNSCEEQLWRLRRWLGVVSRTELRVVAMENAQLFHAHFGTVAVDIWPLVRASGLPMIVTLHGYDINIYREWWESGRGGFRRRSYPEKLLTLAAEPGVHFIAVSDAIRRRAIEYGIPEEKVTVCHIGVNTEHFKPDGLPLSQRPRRLLFIGRLVENKGVSGLIEAFVSISHEFPDAELVIVGDGPLRSQLEKQASGARVCVQFTGALQGDQLKQQLDQARIFCLPSITVENGESEGFGLVLLEAQASGVPVITSSVGAKDAGLLDGETGFYINPGDKTHFHAAISKLLSDDSLASWMSRNSVAFVKTTFDIQRQSRELEAIYTNIVMTRKQPDQTRWRGHAS